MPWKPNWAAEHLQTIRTLMERSAVYRRALAPIMLFAGALGVAAAAAGLLFHLDSLRAFGALWLGTAVVVVAGAFLIARRQAFKDQRAFLVATDTPRGAGTAAAVAGRDVSGRCVRCLRIGTTPVVADVHLAAVLWLRACTPRVFHAARA